MNARVILAVVTCLLAPVAAAAQDAAHGEKLFRKCASCHRIGEGAKNSVGPVLTNVIGRKAGTFDGYKYSKTLIAAGEKGLVWDEARVADYIAGPRKFMRSYLGDPKAKPKMAFKLKDQADRKDVAAYLASFAGTDVQGANATPGDMEPTFAGQDGAVCVTNGADARFLFAVENADGVRSVALLDKAEHLCSQPAQSGSVGTVSVYENADAFEGCSRRVNAGSAETLYRYVSFDRCEWSSNQS